MPNITTSILSPTPCSSPDLGVGLKDTIAPYLMHRFGSGHIPPSTPFVGIFSLPSFGLNTSVLSHGGGSGYMHVGYKSYISSYVPMSNALIPLNAFLMINPPFIL